MRSIVIGFGAIATALAGPAMADVTFDVDAGGALPSGGATVQYYFTVSGQVGVVSDLRLRLSMEANAVAAYTITLTSPGGVVSVLPLGNVGADFDGMVPSQFRLQDTLLSDSAAMAITAGTAPFAGTFQPINPLAAFNGLDPNGVWTLSVTDLTFVTSDSSVSTGAWDLNATDLGSAVSAMLYGAGAAATWGTALGTQLIMTIPGPAGVAMVGLGLAAAGRRRR